MISPLLSNIYLDRLDAFVEDTLRPLYTRGENRRTNPAYSRIERLLTNARRDEDRDAIKALTAERRKHISAAPRDPGYRRLRYVRYADDFLLGFVGPAQEAREIRDRLGDFLQTELKLTLSQEKTLVTHAGDEVAKFLGYEIGVIRKETLIGVNGHRAANGCVTLRMPRAVVQKYRKRFSRKGKVIHRAELMAETDYTIIQRYQSILRGLYNYYCLASNVSRRMSRIAWILRISLLKTLASKHKTRMSKIRKKYRIPDQEYTTYGVTITRPGKDPLVATFGGMSLEKRPDGMGKDGFSHNAAWNKPAGSRSEVVMHLLFGKCALCGSDDAIQMHHIRKLSDIDRPGRRPKARWEKIMAARRRKTIPVCRDCHGDIHAGRHDGPKLV